MVDELPLGERELLRLLGVAFARARVVDLSPVALRSRNRLYRLRLADAPAPGLVLKVLRPEVDRYWDHHLRREHWLLQLLDRFWPGGAPRPYAAVFGNGWGLLLAEDVGATSLAAWITSSEDGRAIGPGYSSPAPAAGERRSGPDAPVAAALRQLSALHATLRRRQRIFYRVCQSVELDRVTALSLLSRVRVARARLAEGRAAAVTALPRAAQADYRARVVRPLIAAPRQMIHNSLSPLNVVLGDRPRFVDWETMAYAAREFDLAELLRFPGVPLSWTDTDALVSQEYGLGVDPTRLRLAALTRAIDYAGSNARQAARSQAEGDMAHAALAGSRQAWYRTEALTIADGLGISNLIQPIIAP